jgi:hypothetical protein
MALVNSNRHSFALLVDGEAIGAEIEECGYGSLKLLDTEPTDPILSQNVCGESQSDEKVCVARRIESQAGGVRRILEMANMRKGQIGAFCKENPDLVFQCGIGSEETEVLDYLPNSKLLLGICGDSRGCYPFVFIPFVAGAAEKLE